MVAAQTTASFLANRNSRTTVATRLEVEGYKDTLKDVSSVCVGTDGFWYAEAVKWSFCSVAVVVTAMVTQCGFTQQAVVIDPDEGKIHTVLN